MFLSGFEQLTPTFRNINNKFSVKYFLNLVLVDEEDRRRRSLHLGTSPPLAGSEHFSVFGRYFKQQEVYFYRKRPAS